MPTVNSAQLFLVNVSRKKLVVIAMFVLIPPKFGMVRLPLRKRCHVYIVQVKIQISIIGLMFFAENIQIELSNGDMIKLVHLVLVRN